MGVFTSMFQQQRASLGPLPVWAVTTLIPHPVQDLLHKRLTQDSGVFLFWGAWGSGKHHYMLHTAREMRDTCANRDVHWVSCSTYEHREDFLHWLAKAVLTEPEQAKTSLSFIEALPKNKSVTIFLHHSELLYLGGKTKKYEAIECLNNLAACIRLTGRHDVNIIWANSRPETAKVALQHANIKLLGPPDCSRWKEEHVRAFVDQRLWSDSKWTAEDKEKLIKLATTHGTVGFIEWWTWVHDEDRLPLPAQQEYAEKLVKRWQGLGDVDPSRWTN